MLVEYDCRYYRGDLPCKFLRVCEGCPSYNKQGKRILIEALGGESAELILSCVSTVRLEMPDALIHCHCSETIAKKLDDDRIDRMLVESVSTAVFLQAMKYDEVVLCGSDKEFHSNPSHIAGNGYDAEQRILLIKLAALGDVLRTTTLLQGIHKAHPGCAIDWMCEPAHEFILKGNEYIDRIIPFDQKNISELLTCEYHSLYSLDKDPGALALSHLIKAKNKYGFGLNNDGSVIALNEASLYSLYTGIDDVLKFQTNRKTYPEIIYDMAEIPYENQKYILNITPEQIKIADRLIEKTQANGKIKIGLNTGCGPVFPLKKWTLQGTIDLIHKFQENNDCQIYLLGGPDEVQRNSTIMEALGEKVVDTGCGNTLHDFIGIVSAMDILITGDTAAMHFGIGLEKYVIALMGPTSWAEIDLFGMGEIVRSGIECSGCTHEECRQNPGCMESISADVVRDAINKGIRQVQPH